MNERYDALRRQAEAALARAEKATKGPWKARYALKDGWEVHTGALREDALCALRDDALFFAAARQDVPALAAGVLELLIHIEGALPALHDRGRLCQARNAAYREVHALRAQLEQARADLKLLRAAWRARERRVAPEAARCGVEMLHLARIDDSAHTAAREAGEREEQP